MEEDNEDDSNEVKENKEPETKKLRYNYSANNIANFDPSVLKDKEKLDHFTLIGYGKRRNGKTTLGENLICELAEEFNPEDVYLWSTTVNLQESFRCVLVDHRYPEWDESQIMNLVRTRIETLEKIQMQKGGNVFPHPSFL